MAERTSADGDPAMDAAEIPGDEEQLLVRVRRSLEAQLAAAAPVPTGHPGSTRPAAPGRGAGGAAAAGAPVHYADAMVALRDEIGEARLEDVPQLVAQMERLQGVALTRAQLQTILVDVASPYFGHLRLREEVAGRGVVEKDVLIGRATYVDPKTRVNIVDWRNAPVSQLYYRYGEGSDYEERFGEREVEGEILVRRTLTIEGGMLQRIAAPQGIWVKRRLAATPAQAAPGRQGQGQGADRYVWERSDLPLHELSGGEQSATRATRQFRPSGVLGAAPSGRQALDRHLPEIAALIDPRQFELMTAPEAGVVVIQGGAGSGKTTIGLHRLAYLAYNAPDRFPTHRMLVVTYGAALASYMEQVLPALGTRGVRVMAFATWAEKELRAAIPWLRATITDEAPPAVTRVKSHPALLHDLERRAAAHQGKRDSRAVVDLWADLLTDRERLMALLHRSAEMPVNEGDINDAHQLMVQRVAAIIGRDPRERPPEKKLDKKKISRQRREAEREEIVADAGTWAAMGVSGKPSARTVDSDLPEGLRRTESERGDHDDDENIRGETGIDGLRTEDDQPLLDLDDVAILLRASQLLRGVKEPLAHLFVDEAQDLSPMKLAVLIGRTSKAGAARKRDTPSITLAGDTSQKLFLDNGFGDWRSVLGHLSLDHVAVEPLRIAYRSTREILALARHAMGPLADVVPPEAPRVGAPVEAFRFTAAGAAVAFLAEALRDLSGREPRATVALLARHPEQADRYFEGLRRAEVPALRRVRAQEFSFRPGVEVTDVRQVKGLEFDYVVMLDANASSYGTDDEARHLFHIGVTRAAHQLWLIVTGTRSPLLPADLLND
ncbi:MAG: ATP-binding domain-containing protein [Myxococcales bacterium]